MAQFQEYLQTLAQNLDRTAQLQQSAIEQQATLIHALSSSNVQRAGAHSGRKRELKALPQHYLYGANASENFTDHIQKLDALRCLQDLDEDEYIRTIKCSLTGQALRASAAIPENDFIGSRTGSRDYIEKLEGLFVSAQQNRAFRLDFSNIKQNR